jgi:uncharacterized protein YbgA (DUF1722 family)
MSCPPTKKQWMNTLHHIFGYFKTKIDSEEKKQILILLEEYRQGQLPLIAPLTVLRHLTQKHSVDYLKGQVVFQPYPKDLLLKDDSTNDGTLFSKS